MIAYYKVVRDKDMRYVVSLYYKNILGVLREMHRSAHKTPKQVNEVISKYRADGYRIQSITTA